MDPNRSIASREIPIPSPNRIRFVLRKSRFFHRYERDLNERQPKALRRMFETGPRYELGEV